jgi:hypothetical protein
MGSQLAVVQSAYVLLQTVKLVAPVEFVAASVRIGLNTANTTIATATKAILTRTGSYLSREILGGRRVTIILENEACQVKRIKRLGLLGVRRAHPTMKRAGLLALIDDSFVRPASSEPVAGVD